MLCHNLLRLVATEKKEAKKVKAMPQLALALLIGAALTIIHQYTTWGKVWEWEDFLHHEVLVGMLVFGALLLVYFVNRRGKK